MLNGIVATFLACLGVFTAFGGLIMIVMQVVYVGGTRGPLNRLGRALFGLLMAAVGVQVTVGVIVHYARLASQQAGLGAG